MQFHRDLTGPSISTQFTNHLEGASTLRGRRLPDRFAASPTPRTTMTLRDPAFTAPGQFWRGNLHTHSTRSDGILSPEEVCRRYRDEGYDFLALTDHFVGQLRLSDRRYRADADQQLHHHPRAPNCTRARWRMASCGTSSPSACRRFCALQHAQLCAERGAGNRPGNRRPRRRRRGLCRHRPSAMVRPDAGRCPLHHRRPCGRDLQPRLRDGLRPARRLLPSPTCC